MGSGGHGSHGHSHSHGDDHGHSHGEGGKHGGCSCSKTVRLSTMLSMTFLFFIVELVVGQITNSVSLTADSFHMLSDVIALIIGLFSVRFSKKQSTKNTFGWVRAEVLGALVNSVFLVSLCLSIAIEAIKRFIDREDIVEVDLLLIVSCIGLGINVIGLVIFGHGHSHGVPEEAAKKLEELAHDSVDLELGDMSVGGGAVEQNSDENELQKSLVDNKIIVKNTEEVNVKNKQKVKKTKCCSIFSGGGNLNIRAVFLHVLADALGSVFVIISALLNKFQTQLSISPDVIRFIDPILCLILVTLILTSTIPLFKETALILLQTVPKDIELNKLKEELKTVNGILAVHELHIWRLSGDKIIASAHITCHNLQEYMQTAAQVKEIFHQKGIHSTTIQPEFVDEPSFDAQNNCILECVKDCNANTCCGQSNKTQIDLRTRRQSNQSDSKIVTIKEQK